MYNVKMLVSKVAEKASGQWGRRDAPCEALESSKPVKTFSRFSAKQMWLVRVQITKWKNKIVELP